LEVQIFVYIFVGLIILQILKSQKCSCLNHINKEIPSFRNCNSMVLFIPMSTSLALVNNNTFQSHWRLERLFLFNCLQNLCFNLLACWIQKDEHYGWIVIIKSILFWLIFVSTILKCKWKTYYQMNNHEAKWYIKHSMK
jgi:hypothetical protein